MNIIGTSADKLLSLYNYGARFVWYGRLFPRTLILTEDDLKYLRQPGQSYTVRKIAFSVMSRPLSHSPASLPQESSTAF